MDYVDALNHVKSRKGMYVYPLDAQSVTNFLNGFLGGAQIRTKHRRDVERSRGWKESPVGPVPQMREKGMTEDEIMDELIEIAVEMCRRASPSSDVAE